jgi:hypothetical protein
MVRQRMPGHEGAKRLRQERWRFTLLLMATPRFAMIFRLRLYSHIHR